MPSANLRGSLATTAAALLAALAAALAAGRLRKGLQRATPTHTVNQESLPAAASASPASATTLRFTTALRGLNVTVLPNHNLLKHPADASHGYTIMLNSISPEWECLPQHSGINKAIAKGCIEDGSTTAVNDALQQAIAQFAEANGAGPTYGDVLVTPTYGALRADGFTAIAHALGADCSDRGKRYRVPLFEPTAPPTLAAVFAAYFRVLAHAGALAPPGGDVSEGATLGLVQISAGVFAADQPKCAEMFALAVRAWSEAVASESSALVRGVTMMCSEQESASIVAALKAAKAMSRDEAEAAVARVLFGEGSQCFLDRVPRAHTIGQKAKEQPPDDSDAPFAYPSLAPFSFATLLSREFLHFAPPASMLAKAA